MTHRGAIPGRLPAAPKEYTQAWGNALVNQLERIHRLLSRPINVGYTITNVTEQRAFDADTITHAELSDVVGTLMGDMKDRGMLGD
jgi:hypothetical protein